MAQHFTPLPTKHRDPEPELPPVLLWVFTYDGDRLVKTAPFDDWDVMERYLTFDKLYTHHIYYGQYVGTHSPENNFFDDDAT